MPISNEEYLKIREQEWERLERFYDFNSVEGIRSIPVPCKEVNGGSPTGRVEYYLRGICFNNHLKNGRNDLALECLMKAQDLMYVSDMIWKYDDFISLVSYLHKIGLHDEARAEEQRVDNFFKKNSRVPKMKPWNFPSLSSFFAWKKNVKEQENEEERKRTLRHEYYWFQEFAPEICPKSISGYSRMKNLKSKKYLELAEFAKSKGFILET